MKSFRWMVGLTLVLSTAAVLEGCGEAGASAGSGTPPAAAAAASTEPVSGAASPLSAGSTQSSSSSAAAPTPSPPARASFWIPIQESPQSAAAGNNGLYVIASNALSSTPAAVMPTTINAGLLAVANQPAAGPEAPTSPMPSLAMYYGTGPDNNVHIYGVSLADTATLPTATQIGSLSLNPASGEHICLADAAQRDKSVPQTLFVIVQITSDSGPFSCGGTGGTYELVNFADSPGTAPIPLPYSWINITNIYQSNGELGGLVTLNAASQLVFYPAGQLAGPATILVDKANSFGPFARSSAAEYFIVPDPTNQTGEQLYKVTSAGVASLVYSSLGNLGGSSGVVDANNLYFQETQAGILSTIWQASLQSDNVQSLYTLSDGSNPSLIGSTGSVLIYGYSAFNAAATIATIPVNTVSKTESVLASFPGNYFSSAFIDSSAAYLYVNYLSAENQPGTAAFAVGTGEQLQVSSSSMFVQAGADVLLLSGIATAGTPGGSTIYNFNPVAATQTPLTLADGSTYTLPQGYSFLTALASGGIGAINLQNASGTAATGAVFDSSTDVIVPLGLANTNVSVW